MDDETKKGRILYSNNLIKVGQYRSDNSFCT